MDSNATTLGQTESRSSDSVRQLSHMQRLIWTGQQLSPQSPLYNSAFRIRIPCRVDAGVFEQAFRAIVERSETLRTTVVMSGTMNRLPKPVVGVSLVAKRDSRWSS